MTKTRATFRDLDGNTRLPQPSSALEVWYNELRDIEIEALDVGDLARACRQDLFPDAIVPVGLKALEDDPLAGYLYDGELLVAMKSIRISYWTLHPEEKKRLLALAAAAFEKSKDSDLYITLADFGD